MGSDTESQNAERSARPWTGQSTWHVANWGPWGWVETALKLLAIGVAVVAAVDDGAWAVPDSHRLTFWILVAISVSYIGSIFDRLTDRELVAMSFVFAMQLGHWSLVYAMGRADWPSGPVLAFVGLMLAGDLVKIGYFVMTGARVRDLPRALPIALTTVLAIAYLVALLAA